MRRFGFLLIIVISWSCQKRKEYLIQVPTEAQITSTEILTELENQAIQAPENDRLIRQQLYFCEQLGWPSRCEQALRKAKDKWGMTEKLLDQSIAYYLKHEEFEIVADLLQGAYETRSRLETKIQIASKQKPGEYTFLNRYLEQYTDANALSFAAEQYLSQGDTSLASKVYDELFKGDPYNRELLNFYLILQSEGKFIKSIQIIENQLTKGVNKPKLYFDLALNYFEIDSVEKAKSILREQNTKQSNLQLIKWFSVAQEWDSALAYTNRLLIQESHNKELVLTKARILESKGWVTPSLPIYEQAFALDTTDVELAAHLEIVRRKVAYLRRKREEENRLLPPDLERKTGN